MITIKKYGNRRLYDSSRSRYINLDELATILRSGEEVEIVDAKTGEDLSREVLLQVFMDVLKGSDFFPTSMLRRIIRVSGDDPMSRMMRQQLATGFELMHQQLDRIEAAVGAKGGGANPFQSGSFQSGSFQGGANPFQSGPFANAFSGGQGFQGNPFANTWAAWAEAAQAAQAQAAPAEPPPEDPEPAPAASPEEELDALRAKLAALEERLSD